MVASSQKSRTFAGRETGGSAEFFGSTECMQARLPELHTMSKSLRRTMFDAIRRMLHSSVNPCSDVWLDAFLKLGLPKLDEPGHTRDFYAFVAEASAYLLPLLALRDGFADRLGQVSETMERLASHSWAPPETDFARGLLAFAGGDDIKAESCFERFHERMASSPDRVMFHHTGAQSFRSRSYLKRLQARPATSPRPLDFVRRADVRGGYVLLLSCEIGYLGAYGPRFLKQVLSISSQVAVHFHVVDPPEAALGALRSQVPAFSDPRVGISREHLEYGRRRTYSAISRYVIAERLLDEYGATILVTDVDMNIRSDPQKLLSRVGPDRIGLYLGRPCQRLLPWSAVKAGHAVFPRNATSREFLPILSAYLDEHVKTGRDGWGLDQTALEFVVRVLGDRLKDRVFDVRHCSGYAIGQHKDRPVRRRIADSIVSTGFFCSELLPEGEL